MPPKSGKDYVKSRININVRLYQSDQREFDLLAQGEFKGNEAEAIRNLVREALRHRRLVNAGKDAAMSIVRASQKGVISDTLQPLIKQIDALQKTIQNLTLQQDSLTRGITNSTTQIASEILTLREQIKAAFETGNKDQLASLINSQLEKLTALMQPLAIQSKTTLKNVIALRSLFYFFLIAYQSGSIDEADNLTRQQWMYFVRNVQKKLNQMSFDEYHTLDAVEQHKFIEDYARKLFEEIKIVKQSHIPQINTNNS